MKKTTIAIGLFGLLIALGSFLWPIYSNKKELTLTITSSISLIREDSRLNDVTVLFRGKPIPNLSKYDFVLENTGWIPISKEDIESPIIIEFSEGNAVLGSDIVSKHPQDIQAEITAVDGSKAVKIEIGLFNQSDYIRFSVFCNGAADVIPKIKARIRGVKELIIKDEQWSKFVRDSIMKNTIGRGALLFIIIATLMFIYYYIHVYITQLRQIKSVIQHCYSTTNFENLRALITDYSLSKLHRDDIQKATSMANFSDGFDSVKDKTISLLKEMSNVRVLWVAIFSAFAIGALGMFGYTIYEIIIK